jgi:hypothetical protein
MTPQETLHSILLDAKARIKDGELYSDKGKICYGLCNFVWYHFKFNNNIDYLFDDLIDKHKDLYGDYFYIAAHKDFTDPKRLALLDWLIERTAP